MAHPMSEAVDRERHCLASTIWHLALRKNTIADEEAIKDRLWLEYQKQYGLQVADGSDIDQHDILVAASRDVLDTVRA